MTDQSAARRANSILATPQDKLNVLCPDKTPAPGLADPMQIEDDPLPPFRHWVEGDYSEEREPTRLDILAIMFGLSLGLWVAAGLAAWKFWPAIEGAFQ